MATTQEWIDELKGISVLELSERIKALEEEFGVSATAVAAAAPAAAGDGAAAEEEVSSTVDVVLTGPASAAQLDENLAALERGPLSHDEDAWMRDFGKAVHG